MFLEIRDVGGYLVFIWSGFLLGVWVSRTFFIRFLGKESFSRWNYFFVEGEGGWWEGGG